MNPYYSNYLSTCSWNTSSLPLGFSVYESNPSSFPLSSDISYPVAKPSVNSNILRNQNLASSVYESHHSFLGNQESSVVMDLDYAKESSTCPWNTSSPPVGSSVYESDLSHPSAQPLVNPNVVGTQNSNKCPTTSGVQCLWETAGKICNRWYQNPEELAFHIDDIHMPKEMRVCHWKDCALKKKTFPRRYRLVNHLRVHTGETPFECDQCGRRFARVENRKLHQRTHTGEKPYLCSVDGCSKRFASSIDCKRHERTHPKPTPFHCKVCNRVYSCLSSLGMHMQKHFEKNSTEISDSGRSSTPASSVCESPAPDNLANLPVLTADSGFYHYPHGNFGYTSM